MAKLSDVISKALADAKPDFEAGVSEAMAKGVGTSAPKPSGKISGTAGLTAEQERIAEIGFIAKTLRGGTLNQVDLKDLNARAKAVGVTGDVAELLPDGFTGTLLRDIKESLHVAKLFPMRSIKGGIAHDTVALHGITAYLTSEATDGTDSAENYKTFVATTQKVLAVVRKSYEVLDDSLIDLAGEVRMGIVRAIAEAVETTVVNGDIAGTQDGTTYGADSAALVANGLRYHGLNKATVDFTGATLTEALFLSKVTEMQLNGGKYMDAEQVAKGNVVLVIDQHTYGKIRSYESFKTKEKAGNAATLFGGYIDTVFDIPVVVTSQLPAVDATGVIDTVTPANNTLSTCVMVNIDTMRLSANGNVVAESDKNIVNQSFVYTGSLRYGFCSIFDSTEAAPNTVVTDQLNVVAGINMER